jgi:hypothetical protein
MEYLVTFPRTHNMIKGEMVLREQGLSPGSMPLPAVLGDSCGFCLRFKEGELERALTILEEASVERGYVYRIEQRKGKPHYEKCYS